MFDSPDSPAATCILSKFFLCLVPSAMGVSCSPSILTKSLARYAFIKHPLAPGRQPIAFIHVIFWALAAIGMCVSEAFLDFMAAGFRLRHSVHHWSNYTMILILLVIIGTLTFVKQVRAYSEGILSCGTCLMTCYIAFRFDCLTTVVSTFLTKSWPPDLPPIMTSTAVDQIFQTPHELVGTCFWACALLYNTVQSSSVRRAAIVPAAVCSVVNVLVFCVGPTVSTNTYGSLFYVVSLPICMELFLFPHTIITMLQLNKIKEDQELLYQSQQRELAHQRATQKADGLLNHILKNNIIDAQNSIDMFLDKDADEAILIHSRALLFRSKWWCKLREAMLRITEGSYEKKVQTMSLSRFCSDLLVGRPVVTLDCPSSAASLDPIACSIVLDNAVTNAIRHGCGEDPELKLTVEISDHGSAQALSFTLMNRAKAGAPQLAEWSASSTEAVHACNSVDPYDSVSTGLGLQHIAMVVNLCGMSAELWQEDAYVYFRLRTETETSSDTSASSDPTNEYRPRHLPSPVHILCIDDSPVARKTLAVVLPKKIPGAVVDVFGETLADVELFKQAVAQGCDIVIVDQNLSFPGAEVEGTTLIRAIFAAGYAGLACVRSANCTDADQSDYFRSGAHCAIDKDSQWPEVVQLLDTAYASNIAHRPTINTVDTVSMESEPQLPGFVP